MIDLNIFTNCTKYNSQDSRLVEATLNSFYSKFNRDFFKTIKIYVDLYPHGENIETYTQALQQLIPNAEIIRTSGLADGYHQSIKNAASDYLFQLEHEWVFLDTIEHTIGQLLNCMMVHNMKYLRFNKRPNCATGTSWDRHFAPETVCGVDFCRVEMPSNNPHIIDARHYNKYHTDPDPYHPERLAIEPKCDGSKGVEDKLRGLYGYVYGGLDHPAVVEHIDGRGRPLPEKLYRNI